MNLPINLVPNSRPPRFRWRQAVNALDGKRWVDHEGELPPSVEEAVATLIGIAKELQRQNDALRGQVEELSSRVSAQTRDGGPSQDDPAITPKSQAGGGGKRGK